jgi:hypothetical protein
MGTGTKAGTSSGVSKEDVYRAYNKGTFFFFFLFWFFLPPRLVRPIAILPGSFPRATRRRRLAGR